MYNKSIGRRTLRRPFKNTDRHSRAAGSTAKSGTLYCALWPTPRWSAVAVLETEENAARPRRRRRAPPGYLTVLQVADRYDFAPSTIYHHVENGEIRAAKWRGLTVIAERDAQEFVAVQPLRNAIDDAVANRGAA
jgi:hypothetical protein